MSRTEYTRPRSARTTVAAVRWLFVLGLAWPTPQDIVATITNGAPGTAMLPFNGRLTPAEISALASLVRSFDTTLKPAGAGGTKH
jgi:hypothetical protein